MELPDKYTQELTVQPSGSDFEGKLSVYDTFRVFMDLANAHAERLGIDQRTFMDRGLFWLTVKTRIKFFRKAAMTTRLRAETWPLAPLSLRTDRCYRLSDEDGLVAEGRTEWAVMDTANGRLADLPGLFPADLKYSGDRVSIEDFPRITVRESDMVCKGTYKVTSSDIDMGLHMNNGAYVRAILGFFTVRELKDMDIREMTVVFRTSAHEGDVLSMRMKRSDREVDCALFLPDGKPAAIAQIIC